MSTMERLRDYWDADADTYDDHPDHRPTSPAVQAAWTALLERLLGPPGRVLDCGAGTGFLSLIAARLGHRVTALDLSEGMLAKLRASADAEGLDIEVVHGPADAPGGPFDVVMERYLLWTLPEPERTLATWRAGAPEGRLLVIEETWGAVDPLGPLRGRGRRLLAQLRGTAPEHHAHYGAELSEVLPLAADTSPSNLIAAITAGGWHQPRLERLRDVEWAERSVMPMVDRLVGRDMKVAITADA